MYLAILLGCRAVHQRLPHALFGFVPRTPEGGGRLSARLLPRSLCLSLFSQSHIVSFFSCSLSPAPPARRACRPFLVRLAGCCERVLVPAVEGVKKLACDARLASLELVPCATLRDALVHAIGTVVDKPPERRRRRRQPGGGDMGDDGDGGGMGGDGDGGDDLGFTGSGGRGLWSSEWAAGR
eukprot:364367-Chlamydomonas_euryale.AAC.6